MRTTGVSETSVQLVSTTLVSHTFIRVSGLSIILVLGFKGKVKSGLTTLTIVLVNTHLDGCGGNFYKLK